MSTPIISHHIDHPSAWKGSDFESIDELCFDFEPKHVRALEDAMHKVKKQGLTLETVNRGNFRLDAIEDDVNHLIDEVMDGRGLIITRGWPMDQHPLDDLDFMYYGLGSHVGRAASQSVMGDRLGEVMDFSDADPHERAYRNRMKLTLHTDLNDIIGMLGVRQAPEGGESQYCSAITIHNEILATRPDLLEPLYEGFHFHRVGEEAPGDLPYTPHKVPVSSTKDGVLTCRWVEGCLQAAANEIGTGLPAKLVEATNYFMEVAKRVQIEFVHPPGWALFANNLIILHGRSEFRNRDNPAEKRLLLRLWLDVDTDRARPYVPEIAVYGSDSIVKQEGRRPTYDGKAWENVGAVKLRAEMELNE